MTPDAPVGARRDVSRLVIYALWDRRGAVDDYVLFALEALRSHATRIVVVANGSLIPEAHAKLDRVADDVLVRDNVGFDIGAHKAGLEHVGVDIARFDEVVLTNDTWFGPVRPFGPVFDRMAEQPVAFWGMADHPQQVPNPFTGDGVLPYHLQSFWIAVRPEMFLSAAWKAYWRDLPELVSIQDAILLHEATFTRHFAEHGFAHAAAFPASDYPSEHPALFNADLLIDAGCPLLKRRPFLHWPPFLDRHAVIGRWVMEAAERHGYPVHLAWQSLARNVEPRVLYTDAAMHHVLSHRDAGYDPTRPFRIAALLHIFYVEMTDEMLDLVDTLPGTYDLYVTTPDAQKAAEITAVIDGRPREGRTVDVRVVDNAGRDQSAFLIGCRDVILDGGYDLVVKLHSKKTPQDGHNVGRHFKSQQFGNLLPSAGYAANVLAMFQKEPGLGLVYPPMIHVGYPTMGRGWWSNKPGFEEYCRTLGIHVPLDEISPLAPYGSMYIARPEALRLLVEHRWTHEDFGGAEAYRDGGLAHILERMPSYVAGELGYHTRTVATAEYTSISHTSMQFNFDQMSATIPGDSVERIMFIKQAGYVGQGRLRDFVRMYFGLHPRVGRRLGWMIDPSNRLVRVATRLTRRR
ncbi:rhamnan synthesis F family protein [Microbacterium allomyrinae]|uniref:Rhamnan synthesis protein F n=1 Tax=Microbacterium allomyrinae TaxID=2830666 RepID=A0A9X1S4D2_9MICO|nr:rhamnan synthesis F family protein [Microbacterium allomyrinae]MCC2033402.1 hypothetical protein [Microbacterium allomyrinae]